MEPQHTPSEHFSLSPDSALPGRLPSASELWDFSFSRLAGAGLVVPEFISVETASRIVSELRERSLIEYYQGDDKAGHPMIKGKFGPNYYRFRDAPEEYFLRVQQVALQFSELITVGGENIFTKVQTALTSMLECDRAEVPSGFIPYTVRDFPTAVPPHSDWLQRDCPDLAFASDVTRQFAWNIYLEMPECGGELRVYRYDARAGGSAAPEEDGYAQILPHTGDLVVFESTHVHEVLADSLSSSRITLSGFAAEREDGSLIFFV